ncbi:cytochrome P450 89A2-like [Aristolochia californica]|uniref:cytochrome P450 89A2-like n=1 Tax=Aristolochia californica TaxID=171875 RepID=UPI0035DFCDBA
MEVYSILLLSCLIAVCLAFFLPSRWKKSKLPPGPAALPIIGNLHWLTRSINDLEAILRELFSHYGPIITLRIGSSAAVFISDHALAHEALISKGAIFADRPPATQTGRVISANQHNINSACYGPLWRLLRRNLTSEILHPLRIKSYGQARVWVLELLLRSLKSESQTAGSLHVVKSFQFAMFCLLVFMCFGQKLDEEVVKEIEKAQRDLILNIRRFNVFAFFPRVGRWVFRKRWNDLLELQNRLAEVLLPLIRSRKETQMKGRQEQDGKNNFTFSYVDSLLSLELPDDGGRRLTEEEIISLCSEFLTAGTDTTSTALEWIMANLVKYPRIQENLVEEIERVVKERRSQGGEESYTDFIKEEELQKMKYLKAVVMEALRRHPPGHFVLPHAVMEEVEINGYIIPKETLVNFPVAEMAMDEKVWKDPTEFKPERFLENEIDITGTREIKMMPFGAGRRICPGLGLAMLHLEFFVVNLVKEFEWKAKDGKEVDLSEKPEFTTVMKNPLDVELHQRKSTQSY